MVSSLSLSLNSASTPLGLFDVGKSEEVKSFPKSETSDNSGDLLGRLVFGVIFFVSTCGKPNIPFFLG